MATQRPQFDIEIESRIDDEDDPRVGEPFEVNIPAHVDEDGEEITEGRTIVVNPPRLSRFLMLQVSYETSADTWEMVSSMTALIFSTFDAEGKSYMRRRFNDPEDPLHLGAMTKIVDVMMETWSARPTEKASGSSSSPGKSGRGSTAKQPSKDDTP